MTVQPGRLPRHKGAYSYVNAAGELHRVNTNAVEDQATADLLLIELQALGMTGGDIEVRVPGIGWVLADDAESAVICRNRQLADQEHVEDFIDPAPAIQDDSDG